MPIRKYFIQFVLKRSVWLCRNQQTLMKTDSMTLYDSGAQVLKATGLSHSFLAKDNFRPGVWTRRNTKCKNFVMHLTVLPSNPKCFLHLSYVSAASATRDGSFSSPVHCCGTSSGGLCSQSHSLSQPPRVSLSFRVFIPICK